MDQEKKKRIVNAAISNMKFVKDAKSAANDPFNQLLEKLSHVLVDARVAVTPILKAGGGFDEPALKQIVYTCVRDSLHKKFDSEEMHVLLTIMICDNVMEDIRSNPRGNDKPDLLSGN